MSTGFKNTQIYKLLGFAGLCPYILFPYWRLLGDNLFGYVIAFAVLSLAVLNILWKNPMHGKNQGSSAVLQLSKFDYFYCISALLILFFYQMKFLNAPIIWCGDENFHFCNMFTSYRIFKSILEDQNQIRWLMLTGLFFIINYFYIKKLKKEKYIPILLIITFLTISIIISPSLSRLQGAFLRYPPLRLITGLPFLLFSRVNEFVYRLPVFILYFSFFLFSFFIIRSLNIKSWFGYLVPVMFITTPLLYYYGSILYIENLLVFIQFWVFFKIFKQRETTESFWFEIACISSIAGAIKEIAIVFLIAVFLLILFNIFIYDKDSYKGKFLLTLRLFYIMFLPVFIYLFFRIIVTTNTRGYPALIGNCLDPSTYYFYFKAIKNQITIPGFLISILGTLYLIISKKHTNVVLLSLLNFILYFVFFASDLPDYTGYSRFTLPFMASFFVGLVGFLELIKKADGYLKFSLLALVLFIVGYNIFSSPRNFTDRALDWEIYRANIYEHYFPYPEALKYISSSYPQKTSCVVAGLDFFYYINFYIRKFNIKQYVRTVIPQRSFISQHSIEKNNRLELNLEGSLFLARKKKVNLLLYHNLYCSSDIGNNLPEAKFVKRFSMGNNCLDLYKLSEF